MNNFQKAINYETVALATHLSDSKVLAMYEQLSSWCDVSASIGDNLNAYKFITGCDEKTLYNAQLTVFKAFETLDEDIEILSSDDLRWPSDVNGVPFLYVKGNIDLLKQQSISIVGTRQASEKAIELTQKCVDAIGREYVIVSGLARGIDGAAHIQALSKKYGTIAVIGTPIGEYYPPEHKKLQEMIEQEGLVVSQFAPSRRIQQFFFIERNVTMSQISKGSIVVESSDSGGGIKQAHDTELQNKPVFVFKDVYDDKSLTWPRKLKSPVVVPSVDQLLACIANPKPVAPPQLELF